MTFLTHLVCSACETAHEKDRLWNLCSSCGMPLLARYDVAAARTSHIGGGLAKDELARRSPGMWRYREMLPDPGDYQSLGEGYTPLLAARRLGKRYGLQQLYIKDESSNPTGSFKARGLAAAVSMARKLGARRACLPSAGNAAAAAAAYGAWVGLPVHVFLPEDTPAPFFREIAAYGATIHRVKGHIGDAGRAMREMIAAEPQGDWFDLSTLKEPYRLEGKKTMGYELAEQLGWGLPEAILYPTGGGTGLIGMWKAFEEMEALGWIDSRRPRMIAVQSTGCAPIVRAFEQGAVKAEPWDSPATVASGLRVPSAIGDFLILRALRKSSGTAVAVEEEKIIPAVAEIGRCEGIFAAPEGAATLLALRRLLDERVISPRERVVLFNTGTGLKYLDAMPFGR